MANFWACCSTECCAGSVQTPVAKCGKGAAQGAAQGAVQGAVQTAVAKSGKDAVQGAAQGVVQTAVAKSGKAEVKAVAKSSKGAVRSGVCSGKVLAKVQSRVLSRVLTRVRWRCLAKVQYSAVQGAARDTLAMCNHYWRRSRHPLRNVSYLGSMPV